ncbi:SRPBCC domain-containing protein [Arthrobacter sp. PM3]|uniref:SRPBCC domain-containing protein n=1 Tax=Arthrobacter sp. PM3 TaxID=2017685 RepID=UPI000E1015A9|nr:SRPBCC domain-containing protein [Arthrobacter sp. PM3]AXJ08647.1 hypothetical protein CFN17_02660 [Arthrobacter sp. PM3]
MTTNSPGSLHVLGSLRAENGKGVVRLEHRFDADAEDLWSALTDPGRLARWLGVVDGDLRERGDFRAHFFASGWEGTCHVDVCRAPQRLLLLTTSPDEPDGVFEVTLNSAGEQTVLVIEDRGMPLGQIAAYGAGDQIHVEDLAAYLAGSERCDALVRWQELHPAYLQLAADLTAPCSLA